MKNFKRTMALIMAASMTASMAACGNSTDAATDTSGDVADEVVADGTETANDAADTEDEVGQYTVLTDADGNPYDLGGMEVIIADWWSSGEEEEPASAYDEARQEYLDWIQETYNFTIKQQSFSTWADMPADFVNYATSGGDENYLFVLYQGSATISAMQSGLMYDLTTIDCLDFSEDKWEGSVKELMSKGDQVFAMRGIPHEATTGIYFNKRLLEEAGIDPDSIYELQRSKEWTWEKFEELLAQCQKDTDNDGVIDQYAMTNFTSSLYPAAVLSNGGSFIDKDSDGKYFNDLESDETMEALNWALDLLDKYEMVYPEDAEWDYTYSAFANGEAAFSCADSYRAGQWTEGGMEDEFGFVCFPMGPNLDQYVNGSSDNIYCIPSCYDEQKAWNIAFAYNLYTDPVPGYEDYAAWKADYYQSFCDTESVDETMAIMVDSGVPLYHNAINGISMGQDLIWGISKDSTPAQQAEAIRNTWQSYLDTTNGQ